MIVTVELHNSTSSLRVEPVLHDDRVLLNRRDTQAILQAWTDGPSRSWLPLGQDLSLQTYVIAFSNDHGRVEMNELHPDADALYSLLQIDLATGGCLRWGQALGEPTPGNQAALEVAIANRLENSNVPADEAELRRFIMSVVGEVYGA